MDLLKYEINNAKKIYFINRNRLKTIIIWFMFYMPLDKNASLNALLSNLILKGSKDYKTNRDITKFLYDHYGAAAGTNINLKGEVYTFSIYTSFVNDNLKAIDDKLTPPMINFMKSVIFNPLIENGVFNDNFFDIEKKNLIKSIENKVNNKDNYAFDRCIEIMCSGEPYEIDKLGKKEWVENITNKEAAGRYLEVIEKMPLNIYVMGNLDSQNTKSLLLNTFKMNEGTYFNIENKKVKKDKIIEENENMDINQSRLCMGFRTDTDFKSASYPSLVVMNKLFGGGPQSKLFSEVREKSSLCYSIYSTIEKHKGLVIVFCGIDGKNSEMVKEKITAVLDNIRNGKFSDAELENAKISSIHDYESIKESNYTFMSYLQGINIYDSRYSIDIIIDEIKRVAKDDIVSESRKLNLDTIYFLGNR